MILVSLPSVAYGQLFHFLKSNSVKYPSFPLLSVYNMNCNFAEFMILWLTWMQYAYICKCKWLHLYCTVCANVHSMSNVTSSAMPMCHCTRELITFHCKITMGLIATYIRSLDLSCWYSISKHQPPTKNVWSYQIDRRWSVKINGV